MPGNKENWLLWDGIPVDVIPSALIVLATINDWVFPLLPEMSQKLRFEIFVHYMCPNFLADYSCTCLHVLSVADEISEEWRQLVTASHDNSDGLILCE